MNPDPSARIGQPSMWIRGETFPNRVHEVERDVLPVGESEIALGTFLSWAVRELNVVMRRLQVLVSYGHPLPAEWST